MMDNVTSLCPFIMLRLAATRNQTPGLRDSPGKSHLPSQILPRSKEEMQMQTVGDPIVIGVHFIHHHYKLKRAKHDIQDTQHDAPHDGTRPLAISVAEARLSGATRSKTYVLSRADSSG